MQTRSTEYRMKNDEYHGRHRCLLIFAAALLILASTGWAQEPPKGPSPSVRASDKADLYDIDASGTDLKFVLEALARRSGANIVVSPEITGEINAHLKQMSVDSILDYLSTVQGFKWEKTDGTYLVASKEKLAKPPAPVDAPPPTPAPDVLVWECKHVKAADLITTIGKLYPNLKTAEGPGALTPIMDSSQSGSGGSDTSGGSSTGSTSTTTSGTNSSGQQGNKIVLIGSKDELALAASLLTQLDVRRKQISIQVEITEINSTASKELGIQWSWNDATLTETAATGIGFGKFNKQPMTINATISALIEKGKANLLAQPNLSVLDGENAEILIGDRILYAKMVGTSQYGTPLYDKAEEKVGIYLQIAPRIAEDEVILTLYPQVSLVTSYLKTQAGDYPQISTREAKTTVSVKNGNTLAIGGLVQENEINNASKVPLLGDLPIIGQFFRHVKKSKDRTEIVIFLTPKIVEGA